MKDHRKSARSADKSSDHHAWTRSFADADGDLIRLQDLPSDALFSAQTNLFSQAKPSGDIVDINVAPLWAMGFTGRGVSIGVFDTAMDVHHRDLSKNINLAHGAHGRHGHGVDPTHVARHGDEHATAVAGIIAAERNGTGVVGIAYHAEITPVDIFAGNSSHIWSALRQLRAFDIANDSWGYAGAFVANPLDPVTQADLRGFTLGADHGRDGLGTIQNVAAGNYRQYGLSTETNGLTVDRHVIAVGATDRYGNIASYSNPGASLLVVAPSSGDDGAITTTDVTGPIG